MIGLTAAFISTSRLHACKDDGGLRNTIGYFFVLLAIAAKARICSAIKRETTMLR